MRTEENKQKERVIFKVTFEDKLKIIYPDWNLAAEVYIEVGEIVEELELVECK